MNANASNTKPVFDDSGLEDGGAIGNLPRFAPPAPEVQQPVPPSGDTPEAVKVEAPAAEQPQPAATVAPVEASASVEQPGAAANDTPATVVLNDEGATQPVNAEATTSAPAVEAGAAEGAKPEAGEGKPEVTAEASGEAKKDDPAKDATQDKPEAEKPQQALPSLEDQLKAVAASILAERGADPSHPQARLTEEELARVAQHLNLQGGVRPDPNAATLLQPIGAAAAPGAAAPNTATVGVTAGQSVQMKGGAAIAEGAAALVGGALNLAGTAGKVVGQAAHHVADLMKPKDAGKQAEAAQAEAVASGLPAVLPRLSEYRIAQVEKAADNFGQEADAFWNSSTKLTALRSEMERVARERGLSVQDVAEKMKPGGDFAELREKFNAAVAENPDSGTRKKAMDKALDSYVRQYGRAQEELLNPEQNGNPHYDRYKDRLHRAHENIEQKSSGVPAFANDKGELEPSHFEKLKEAVAKIMEKLKEVAKEFVAMFRGKSAGDDHAPAP